MTPNQTLWPTTILTITLALAGCGSDDSPDVSLSDDNYEIIEQSSASYDDITFAAFGAGSQLRVLTSQEEYEDLLAELPDSPTANTIDFDSSRVIFAYTGSTPNSCYGIGLNSITATDHGLAVNLLRSSSSDSSCSQVLTASWLLVQIDTGSSDLITFTERW
ncbi:hypothetical protein [Oceanobacter mangrovi]|uniref:hypothetical protein n=1 Tax=Oceanobacter mangrovi TaxID=2862510 RepID=UPI001C8DF0C5|nr:hypothetical protein [Oceanobacter mangrovi]